MFDRGTRFEQVIFVDLDGFKIISIIYSKWSEHEWEKIECSNSKPYHTFVSSKRQIKNLWQVLKLLPIKFGNLFNGSKYVKL